MVIYVPVNAADIITRPALELKRFRIFSADEVFKFVRDDRIHLFVDLMSARQVYYYAVRAVSTGTYKMGPISADAMYNGEYHSYNGGGTVKIIE